MIVANFMIDGMWYECAVRNGSQILMPLPDRPKPTNSNSIHLYPDLGTLKMITHELVLPFQIIFVSRLPFQAFATSLNLSLSLSDSVFFLSFSLPTHVFLGCHNSQYEQGEHSHTTTENGRNELFLCNKI